MANNNEVDNQDIKIETPEVEEVEIKQELLTVEEELQKELDEKNEQYLRLAAEYDNFRKRSQKEKECIYSDARAMVIAEILPVLDNYDRASENVDSSTEDYKKGVDMIFSQFIEILEKMDVESFGKPNDEFDPNIHNAVMHIEDDNFGENSIAEVFLKGYKIGDKILRPAMVKVAN